MTATTTLPPADLEKAAGVPSGGEQAKEGEVEFTTSTRGNPGGREVKRALKARHLQMIALGGTIGTGLFIGAGSALHTGGSAGLCIGYTLMGTIVYAMMAALGEMVSLFPVPGAFVHFASRFLDPAIGFALGWNYWIAYCCVIPTEVVAASIVLDYWSGARGVSSAVWITVFIVVVVSINFFGVATFGEVEFWFSAIKIVTILGLIICALVITAGGVPSSDPTEYPIGFRYWHTTPFQQMNNIPGAWGRFLSFWTVFIQAAFSFLGTEVVALTAAEAENPRRNVPKAINRVFWRIVFFYVIGVLMISLIVSPNNPRLISGASDASASPWVIGMELAGIRALPHIVNAVILVAAFSAGNSVLYAASRTLYGMAMAGQAPGVLGYCTKGGLPVAALGVTALWSLLAFMTVKTGGATAFNYLVSIGAVTGLVNWAVMLGAYIRFYHALKLQGIDRRDFPFRAPLQPYLSYFGFVMICLIILFSGYRVFLAGSWSTGTFLTSYITLPVFALMWVVYKFVKKTKWVSLKGMDFESNRRELDQMEAEQQALYRPPRNTVERVWDWLM